MPLPKLSRLRIEAATSARAFDDAARRPYLPPAPEAQPAGGIPDWCARIARTLNQAIRGNLNCVADVVLTTTLSTIVVDGRIGLYSAVLPMPSTATAGALTGMWFEIQPGQVTIHHPASADIDRTLRLVILG